MGVPARAPRAKTWPHECRGHATGVEFQKVSAETALSSRPILDYTVVTTDDVNSACADVPSGGPMRPLEPAPCSYATPPLGEPNAIRTAANRLQWVLLALAVGGIWELIWALWFRFWLIESSLDPALKRLTGRIMWHTWLLLDVAACVAFVWVMAALCAVRRVRTAAQLAATACACGALAIAMDILLLDLVKQPSMLFSTGSLLTTFLGAIWAILAPLTTWVFAIRPVMMPGSWRKLVVAVGLLLSFSNALVHVHFCIGRLGSYWGWHLSSLYSGGYTIESNLRAITDAYFEWRIDRAQKLLVLSATLVAALDLKLVIGLKSSHQRGAVIS